MHMVPPAWPILVGALLCLRVRSGAALHAYGHAFSRPGDFTDEQIAAVASRFGMFTVEKGSCADRYGQQSSIAATVGTAKRIKALNAEVKVLMYWNAAINFNLYECEKDVEPTWLIPSHRKNHLFYNYSVPQFREWWVKCAVDAVQNSGGVLSGLFLDATPKVASGQCYTSGDLAMTYWKEMVDQIRAALGPASILIDNGFYLGGRYPQNVKLAGTDAWKHTGSTYVESLASVGTSSAVNPEQDIAHLRWIANSSSSADPSLLMIGHGTLDTTLKSTKVERYSVDTIFLYGLAKYLLVTRSVENGWYLANQNYSIDGGLLEQPKRIYEQNGLACGEPLAEFIRLGDTLTREFEYGRVSVNIVNGTATIDCNKRQSIN